MTGTVSLPRRSVATRPAAPSLGVLTGVEVRKSLSTRSGKAVAGAAALLGPVGTVLGSLLDNGPVPAPVVIGMTGTLTALVLLALGVLSTAGEWTHGSVQVTFLLVPQRLRVLMSKGVAVAFLGAAVAAVGAMASVAVLAAMPAGVDWMGTGRAVAVLVAGGAAYAVVGAGIGATLGNSAAALTGTYLVMLGGLPVLSTVKPTWAEKVDTIKAIATLAQDGLATRPVLVVVGWVLLAVTGAVLTRRRPVQ